MDNESAPVSATVSATIGGTIVAAFVTFIVLLVVSTLVAFLMSMVQYYLGSMRWEAATFIGNVFGGVVSIYAARASCDAVIKRYSLRSIFVVLTTILGIVSIHQLSTGLSQETVFRLAFSLPMIGAAWYVFWQDDYS